MSAASYYAARPKGEEPDAVIAERDACPFCKAKRGQWCVDTRTGEATIGLHASRRGGNVDLDDPSDEVWENDADWRMAFEDW